MLDKKFMVIAILFISLAAVSAVSAAEDTGDIVAIQSDAQINEITNDILTDGIQSDALEASANDESEVVLAASDDAKILTDSKEYYVNASYTGSDKFGTKENPYTTLNETLNADDLEDGYKINIAAGNYTGEENIGFTIYNKLTLQSWGPGEVIFDAQHESPILCIDSDEFNVTGITFINGNSEMGGALYFSGDLKNSHIEGAFINNSALSGGAIYVMGNVENSEISAYFYNNTAGNDESEAGISDFDLAGGAIFVYGNMNDSVIEGNFEFNHASMYGGAIYASEGIINSNVSDCYFNSNYAMVGGAINTYVITYSTIESKFVNNTAVVGGAIFANVVNNTKIDSNFTNNAVNSSLAPDDSEIIDDLFISFEYYVDEQFSDSVWNIMEKCSFNSGFGGAIGVVGILENSTISGEFTNNTGVNAGGAVCVVGIANESDITGQFMLNKAIVGGSLLLPVVVNSNISGEFTYNFAVQGGAIFADLVNNTNINGNYTNNSALAGEDSDEGLLAWGGAICIDGILENSTIDGIFMYNDAVELGGAIGGIDFVINSTISGRFINNTAKIGGAINAPYLYYSNISGHFENNRANRGGAIFTCYLSNTEITADFVNNDAIDGDELSIEFDGINIDYSVFSGLGGAFCVIGTMQNAVFTGDFIENHAVQGGAIFAQSVEIEKYNLEWLTMANNAFNSDFISNVADRGAAICIAAISQQNKLDSNFINNNATGDGIIFLGGESIEDSIINCLFMNNTVANSIIHIERGFDTNINNNIFLNPLRTYDIEHNGIIDSKLSVNDNWFGHNATNYMESLKINGVAECNTWLFLNASANPDTIPVFESSDIVFKLYSCNASGNISEFDDTLLKPVYLTISSTKGDVNSTEDVKFGEPIKYSATNAGTGSVTAEIGNVFDTVILDNLKLNSTLTINNITFDYGKTGSTTVDFTNASGVIAEVINQSKAIVVVKDGIITVSGLGAGIYTLNVTTITGENFNSISKTATVTVKKVNSTVDVNDTVLNYGETAKVDVKTDGVIDVTAELDGEEIAVRDGSVSIPVLGAGTHNLTVVTIPDANHTSVNKTVKITVNKVDSFVDVNGTVLNYGETTKVNVKTDGAEGITAELDGDEIIFSGDSVPIPVLDAGTYNLTVVTIPDDNHTSVNKTVKITVNKVDSFVDVNGTVLNYGETTNVSVAYDGAEGITAELDGDEIVFSGDSVPIPVLDVGTYNLTVTTIPNKNHIAVNKTVTVTVLKQNTTFDIEMPINITTGEESTAKVEMPDGATGEISVSFDGGKPTNVQIVDGTANIIIPSLSAGPHTVKISYPGDNNYNPAEKSVEITVSKKDSKSEIVLDGDGLNVKLSPDAGGEVTLKVDGDVVSTEAVTNGVASFDVSDVSPGDHTVEVLYSGDDKYNPAEVSKEITVPKKDVAPEIVIDDDAISVTLPADAEGDVTLKVDGDVVSTVPVTNGVASFDLSDVSPGDHTVEIAYSGDNKYNPAEKSKEITVPKRDATPEIVIDDDAINVSLPADAEGNATLKVDGEVVSTEAVDNGTASFDLSDVSPGNHTVEVLYSGDDKYNPAEVSKEITVSKKDATPDIVIEGDGLNVNLPADAKGNVTVKVDGNDVGTKPLVDGTASFDVSDVSPGNHTVEVSYSGDDKYNPVEISKEITVPKKDAAPEIVIDDNAINVSLPSDAKGNVTLAVDGEVASTKPVVDGTASFELPELTPGNHTVEISYSGDDKYNPGAKTTTVTVAKKTTNLTAADVTTKYKSNKKLVITLTDSQGNPITNANVSVKLKKVKKYTTDDNGQIKIKVGTLVPGTYDAQITFNGNENYTGSNATANVVVKKVTPKIVAKNKSINPNIKTKYTVKLTYKGKAIKKATVYLIIGKKKYSATTDKNGKATFKVKLYEKGTYDAVVKFKGNNYYKKATKTVKITVKNTFKTIGWGSNDEEMVKIIQSSLKNHRYYLTSHGHYLMIDGYYGPYTTKAVFKFQKANHLTPTGKVDYATAVKLGIIM